MLLIPAIALGAWLFQRSKSSAEIDRSIAVLPFENLSGDKENAYLAEGIPDDDALIEGWRAKGDIAQLDAALQEQA